ncbi:sulfate/molybdate ABC transporter ATP-binding protein [Faecalicatena contorta]|uniref:ABC-type quaternary amine transporter n=1 Tax=Faecalicatena contorta TaxID=39482 RepID=A0A315ZZA5_9FIRM|nr:sulfate ABC transporter ATP-binding protein [Faecalicatena contorta]PWJ50609.1 sulfate transport system ATP-binding protein [Faecalicatena contorta]SUQ14017.1 sulfate transport system ATP-binding protein [Faecalicatena contorta]
MYVELHDINKRFGTYQAADHVSFSIEKGKLIGLLGPSGSGKTTILRMIAGLETPDSGDILIDGRRVNDLPASKRGIGFVFQNYALFRYMTVFDNIAFGLEVQKKDKAYIRQRVNELIKLIGLEGLEKRHPHQLSGGQKQRVAFARALAPSPQLLLLDEPFAAIDAKVRKELRTWLRETINKVGITSIFVTHDQEEAVEVADEIIITNSGHIEQIGSPADIYKNPATPFAAKFIGESIVVENYGRLHGFEEDMEYNRAVIRPEFVRVTKKEQELYPHASKRGTVEDILFRGNMLELRLNVDGVKLITYRSLEDAPLAVGEEVSVLIYRLYLYNNHQVRLVENAAFQSSDAFAI